jgi:hypothetical protein
MKNAPRDLEIEPEDFDSIFLWKVFWKLLKQENPLCFFLKVILLGAAFVTLILFILLVGDLAGA